MNYWNNLIQISWTPSPWKLFWRKSEHFWDSVGEKCTVSTHFSFISENWIGGLVPGIRRDIFEVDWIYDCHTIMACWLLWVSGTIVKHKQMIHPSWHSAECSDTCLWLTITTTHKLVDTDYGVCGNPWFTDIRYNKLPNQINYNKNLHKSILQ